LARIAATSTNRKRLSIGAEQEAALDRGGFLAFDAFFFRRLDHVVCFFNHSAIRVARAR
jgi:hypothetical protein